MKQNRKISKVIFKGESPLVKVGCFAEIDEASDPEYDTIPPVAIVAEEHVPVLDVEDDNDDEEDNDEDDNDDDEDDDDENDGDEGVEIIQGGDTLGFNDDDFFFDFEPNNDDLSLFFDDFNDVGISPTETEGDPNILKVPFQTPDQMADIIAKPDSTARIPPQAVATPTIIPSESDLQETQASQPPLKRRRADPRLEVLIREQVQSVQQSTATVRPTQPTHVDSQVLNEGPSGVRSAFEVGISSAPGGSSTPQPTHDVAFERLARFLARQGVDPAPRGKGISIGAGSPDKEDSTIFELKEEIGILNQKLIEKDVFKTSVTEPNEAETSQSAHAQATQDSQDITPHVVSLAKTTDKKILDSQPFRTASRFLPFVISNHIPLTPY
ncbi:unnamed protein product [Lactuca virosa]|uniref:Uncharacterized protein n=1 Tax=Lactuca virosa TaxID=75947 RepID=A0AAU9N9X9_9ASTR|nr:unnamed protein product [Lactuca virosa]